MRRTSREETTERPFRVAWRHFKASPGTFIASALVVFLLWALLEILVITLAHLGTVINISLHIIFMALMSAGIVGLHGLASDSLDGRPIALRDLARWLPRGPHFLAAAIIYTLCVGAGLIALAVPGLYVAVRFGMFPHVLATQKAGPIDALRFAARLSQGQTWRVGGILARSLLLTLAGAAVLGVGALITYPVAVIATTSAFRSLLSARHVAPNPALQRTTA